MVFSYDADADHVYADDDACDVADAECEGCDGAQPCHRAALQTHCKVSRHHHHHHHCHHHHGHHQNHHQGHPQNLHRHLIIK